MTGIHVVNICHLEHQARSPNSNASYVYLHKKYYALSKWSHVIQAWLKSLRITKKLKFIVFFL